MNIKTITLTACIFVTISALFFNSCRVRERDEDKTEAEESILLERTNDDVINIVSQADNGTFLPNYNCALITRNLVAKTIELDFGTVPYKCADGKNRTGKILIAYEGNFMDSGATRIITYENYFVDTNQVKGNKTLLNIGKNTAGNTVINMVSADTIIKKKTLEVVTAALTRKREYTGGTTTPYWEDDTYSVTGSGSGTRANGFNFTCKISKALQMQFNCVYRITSGEMQIQPQAREIRVLDFGDNTCDKNATLSINDQKFNIEFQ